MDRRAFARRRWRSHGISMDATARRRVKPGDDAECVDALGIPLAKIGEAHTLLERSPDLVGRIVVLPWGVAPSAGQFISLVDQAHRWQPIVNADRRRLALLPMVECVAHGGEIRRGDVAALEGLVAL